MKKIILLSACGLLLGIFQMPLQAQLKMDKPNPGIGSGYDFTSLPVNASAVIAARNLEKVNRKVIRQFVGWYKDTKDENWIHANSGIMVKFQENGLEKLAAFNAKGNWLFTIIYFGERNLPDRIRWLVRSRFFDFEISGIEQVESPASNIYIVHMQNDSHWINLRVHNEEIKIMEDFIKF